MGIFARLQDLRRFERRYLPFLLTFEDYDLTVAIGAHQVRGSPVTMKQIIAFDIGAVATLQRRVARLKRLGIIVSKPLESDRRNVTLELSARTLRVFQRYSALLSAQGNPASPDLPSD